LAYVNHDAFALTMFCPMTVWQQSACNRFRRAERTWRRLRALRCVLQLYVLAPFTSSLIVQCVIN